MVATRSAQPPVLGKRPSVSRTWPTWRQRASHNCWRAQRLGHDAARKFRSTELCAIVGKSSVAVPRSALQLAIDARRMLRQAPPGGTHAIAKRAAGRRITAQRLSLRLSWRNIANVLVSPDGGLIRRDMQRRGAHNWKKDGSSEVGDQTPWRNQTNAYPHWRERRRGNQPASGGVARGAGAAGRDR